MPLRLDEVKRVGLDELERVVRLRVNIDADDLEARVGVALRCAAGRAKEVE
jgi:hypothetical protein